MGRGILVVHGAVLVSYCCITNHPPQTQWLKKIEIFPVVHESPSLLGSFTDVGQALPILAGLPHASLVSWRSDGVAELV